MYQEINRTGKNSEKVESWVWGCCCPTSFCLILLVSAAMVSFGMAQGDELQSEEPASQATTDMGMVVVDGRALFPVKGTPSIPAEERAELIAQRIWELASDRTYSPEKLTITEAGNYAIIMFGEKAVLRVHGSDAATQEMEPSFLAGIFKDRIVEAIRTYRDERSLRYLANKSAYSVGAVALFVLAVFLIRRLSSRLKQWLTGRYTLRFEEGALESVPTERLLKAADGLIYGIRTLVTLVLIVACTNYILSLFPWTRPLANQIWALLLSPVSIFARGSLDAIPGLIFIGMLTLVVRYILKLLRLLSAAIENGSVTFSGFEPEWAWPLFKLVRIAAIALGVVVAFPYIPGSQTEAFKGVSIFIGVVLSLGSSAMISNSISGYMLTFRQAFKVGDRVKIGEQVGNVLQIRNNVTYLASLENEVVTVPNSSIMNSVVINYSAGARKKGLRLPIMVSIGYETPWRQVEAMLLLAAKRTSGLLRQPSPFVAIRGLGDFAVAYQLNAYTDQPQKKGIICTELHRNILDVFNEYEIQIMSPAYEGDPDQPKVVPKDKWYAPPALPADGEPPMQDEPK